MTDRNESRPRSADGCCSEGMAYISDLHLLSVKPQPGVATISHHETRFQPTRGNFHDR